MPEQRRGTRQRTRWFAIAAAVAAAIVAVAVVFTVVRLRSGGEGPPERSLSELDADIAAGRVGDARIDDATRTATVTGTDGGTYTVAYPADYGPALTDKLLAAHVPVSAAARSGDSNAVADVAIRVVPSLLILGLLAWLLLRRGGLLGQYVNIRNGRGASEDVPDVTFDDVAGNVEVVDELREVVWAIREPQRFTRLGAHVPRGILLTGPPGTGKTLLARAVAGEAGVPFLSIAGSDFVEMFAGVGASRMRRLFDRARSEDGAVVFIDEIDAIGKSRITGHSNGASEERENTLNQLLVELDGFSRSESVFVLAATNRADVLDAALTRPGRFDRTIAVGVPDAAGRREVLELHAREYAVAEGIDWAALAKRTPGMTGADLANVMNQASLIAVRHEHDEVLSSDIVEAIAVVTIGPERRSRVPSDRDRRIAAVHEAGHTVCALCQPEAPDPVQVSIVPRGEAGGVTWTAGTDDDFVTLRQAQAQLVLALGGRAAEELVLDGDVSHGAMGDLRTATDLARRMVTEFGMTGFGLAYLDERDVHVGGAGADVHDAVRAELDAALGRARELVSTHRELLDAVTDALLEHETLDPDDLAALHHPPVG
ncbi:MAG: AAA family ATPase [Acidimicrobiia bacterium]|nr:AAA family ATPase [Acidimicrobiia bacterium]